MDTPLTTQCARLTRVWLCALAPLVATTACKETPPARAPRPPDGPKAAPAPAVDPPPIEPAPAEPGLGRLPQPPTLPSGATGCIVRRLEDPRETWRVVPVAYDPSTRTIDLGGEPRGFDERGRLLTVGRDEPGFAQQRYRYDEHGNLLAWTEHLDGEIRRVSRWTTRYEGTPPRTKEVRVADYDGANEARAREHTRRTYRYASNGELEEETLLAQGQRWTGRLDWQDGLLHAIEWVRDPRAAGAALAHDAIESFGYDAAGRLSTYTRDGETTVGASPADGKPDQVMRFEYDAHGRLARVLRDGRSGDVAPEPPDGEPDGIVLLTPECDPVRRLWPAFFELPDPMLPATTPVQWR